jgi:hypothetical protein
MTIERLVPIADSTGLDHVIVVPPSLEGIRFDYGQVAALRHPGRFAKMGLSPLRHARYHGASRHDAPGGHHLRCKMSAAMRGQGAKLATGEAGSEPDLSSPDVPKCSARSRHDHATPPRTE